MMTHVADEDVMETSGAAALSLVGDAEVDIQVATARRFPRSITTFMRKAQQMATLTPDIAASCIYAIPRDGKTVEGPSARFAELVMNAWGNMRAEGKTTGDDGQFVTARGVAWDLESNTAIGYEVKRRITNRSGQTFSADMITVTGNAGASIALRNAILKAIPTPFWKPIYNACRKVVAGDAKTFASRCDNMLHEFAIMGVTEERLCAAIGVKGKADITLEHMATLAGFYTALKDGDTTIEEAFPETGGLGTPQPAQRKSAQPSTTTSTPAPSQAAPASPVDGQARDATAGGASGQGGTPAPAPAHIGAIVTVDVRPTGTLITMSTGFKAATRDEAIVRAATMAKDAGMRVELVTKPAAQGPRYAPNVVEVKPLADGVQA